MIPRILCSIPSYSGPDPRTYFYHLLFAAETGRAEALGEYKVRWSVAGPKDQVLPARNQACRFSIMGDCTHLLLADDDMLMQPDILEKLLAEDKPIIAPIFFRSGSPYDPLVFKMGDDGEPDSMTDYPVDQVFPAPGGVGTGLMLIKVEVLKAMMQDGPWFRYPPPGSTRGMDLDFCIRAAKYGFISHCDSRLLVEQMGLPQPVGRAQWEARRKTQG